MKRKGGLLSLLLAVSVMLTGLVPELLAASHRHHHVYRIRVHERHHKRHHHHSKVKKIAAVAAPIGIGMAFGPAGSVGYQIIKHRKAIKQHLLHHHR